MMIHEPRPARSDRERPAKFLLITSGAIAGLLLGIATLSRAGDDKPAEVEFNRDIRPILSENCYACHGPDKNQRKAQLRLDERASAIKLQAIVPGQPDDSELINRITTDDPEQLMPPASSHKSLTAEQKDLLNRWIAQGASYQAHWAYVPPAHHPIPKVNQTDWVREPIDAFILSKLEEKGIKPSPEADRRRLIRRLSLDLIGLPPTPEEVRSFEQDNDPNAYERLVDRLLESPHYGERMAVTWLDLARAADTVGYHGDQGHRMFPYRDYVIDSFNQNKPFDQFTIEQLAGDLLPNPTPEQLVATGFNRLNMMTREGGAQPGEYLAKYAGDRVRTVSITWLGSTMGCAECHDHKYDPFTARDFYSMAAFFADLKQWGVYHDYDYTPNPDLKGWSNDHPFPPEIEVESLYLIRRRQQLRDRIRSLSAEARNQWNSDEHQRKTFESWLKQASDFARRHPDGWRTLSWSAGEQSQAQPDGRVLLKPSDSKNLTKEIAWTFQGKPGANTVSRIKVELLPDAANDGKVTLGGAENASIRLQAFVQSGESKDQKPLAFYQAEADLKEPRYFNGDEVAGILGGWRSSKAHVKEPQTGVWYLASPLEMADGDELKIVVHGKSTGCVRLAISPFGFDPGGQTVLDDAQRQAITANDADRTEQDLATAAELYVLSRASLSPNWNQVQPLCMELFDIGDGKTHSMIVQAVEPMVTRVLPRGNWLDTSGPIVEPAVPAFLPQPKHEGDARLTRLDLARWITASDNPLTARVFMNRLWKQLFGTGISSLVEDVGAQGEWPVHPELLDWLAIDFQENGWDVKRMVKRLVMSSTYRQDSRIRPELRDIDPNNRLLALESPRRLDAEFVRDNALAIAGLINLDLGGPSVFPYQPGGYYANLQFPDRDYIADPNDREYRRGVYMHWQRTFLHPMLANFDAPAREDCIAARNVANTPQQALTLLNDPTFVEAARVMAASVLAARRGSDADRINLIYEKALARSASEKERQSLLDFLEKQRAYFQNEPSATEQLLGVGNAPIPPDLSAPELAAWAAVCRVVLDLHETITRY